MFTGLLGPPLRLQTTNPNEGCKASVELERSIVHRGGICCLTDRNSPSKQKQLLGEEGSANRPFCMSGMQFVFQM